MITVRRYAIYAAIAIFLLLTITHYRGPIAARINYSSFLPKKTTHTDGRFHWEDVPIYYPVKSLTSLPSAKPTRLPKVQFDFKPESPEHAVTRLERRSAVKATFQKAWKAYKEHAWMHDEVAPLTGGSRDGFGGWGASLVDSLDTLWIMDLKEEFEEAVQASMAIDLGSCTTDTVNVFETTIRHLGGFLSAYDLSGDRRLLSKAKEFGEMLLKAFDTPNRMPITRWKPQEALSGPQEADPTVLVAEIGSLSMEFTHLSQLTGDMRFYDAVARIMSLFAAQQENTHLNGMFPVSVDGKSADFTRDTFFTLGAMSDSLYEYFPKMHALLGGTEPIYGRLYRKSMQTAIKHNLWKPMTPENADILMSGGVRVEIGKLPELEPQGQHLVCFAGGMFALGGKLFKIEKHENIGKKLTDGCIWTYRAFDSGVMPEIFGMLPCASLDGQCPFDEQKWKAEVKRLNGEGDQVKNQRLPKGFTAIYDRRYILRPEAIESVFILYRTTGEEYLLEAAWEMFQAIVNATTTELANAALADVTFSKEQMEIKGLC